MHLIDDWRNAHRWHSVRIASFGVAVSAVSSGVSAIYGNLSPITRAAWPAWVQPAVLAFIFLGVIVGRLVKQ